MTDVQSPGTGQPKPSSASFCSSCGVSLTTGAQFCSACGAQIVAAVAPKAEEPVQPLPRVALLDRTRAFADPDKLQELGAIASGTELGVLEETSTCYKVVLNDGSSCYVGKDSAVKVAANSIPMSDGLRASSQTRTTATSPVTSAQWASTVPSAYDLAPSQGPGILPWSVAAAACLVVIGSFGPWVEYPLGQSQAGMDGDGIFTLLLGAGAIAALQYRAKNMTLMRGAIISSVLLGITAVLGVVDAADIQNKGRTDFFGEEIQTATVGWGLGLIVIAAITGCVLAIVLAFKDNARISGSARTSQT